MRSRGKAVISHVIKQLSELDLKEHITPSLVIAQPENAQHRRGSAVPDGEERPLAPGPSSPSPCRSVALMTEISVNLGITRPCPHAPRGLAKQCAMKGLPHSNPWHDHYQNWWSHKQEANNPPDQSKSSDVSSQQDEQGTACTSPVPV